MDKITAMKYLESKFTSHNSVEVERATITREEFEAIKPSQWISVDTLAEIIRKVDGKHNLGAGALAEAILAELGPTE